MSSNPLDRRSQRSRHAILNAMLTLLGEQTFAQISVAQICLRADVARPTFYLHFSSKQEALLSFMDDVFEQFFAGVEPQLPLAELDTQAICLQLFEQWQRHRQLLRALLDAGLESTMQQRFRHYGARLVGRYLSQRQLSVPEPALMPYLIDSIAATALAFLMRWLREDLVLPAAQMAAFYEYICRNGMLTVLNPLPPAES